MQIWHANVTWRFSAQRYYGKCLLLDPEWKNTCLPISEPRVTFAKAEILNCAWKISPDVYFCVEKKYASLYRQLCTQRDGLGQHVVDCLSISSTRGFGWDPVPEGQGSWLRPQQYSTSLLHGAAAIDPQKQRSQEPPNAGADEPRPSHTSGTAERGAALTPSGDLPAPTPPPPSSRRGLQPPCNKRKSHLPAQAPTFDHRKGFSKTWGCHFVRGFALSLLTSSIKSGESQRQLIKVKSRAARRV